MIDKKAILTRIFVYFVLLVMIQVVLCYQVYFKMNEMHPSEIVRNNWKFAKNIVLFLNKHFNLTLGADRRFTAATATFMLDFWFGFTL